MTLPTIATKSDRLFAQVINYGILLGLTIPLALIEAGWIRNAGIALVLFYGGLQCYHLVRSGQSIGKKVMKIRIVDEKTLDKASFEQVIFYRWFCMGFLSGVPGLAVVDVLMIFRKDRRCLHDFLASTLVVKAGNPFQ